MGLEIVADLDEIGDGSAEWHELRRTGIGASDASAIVGVNPWRSPYDLWTEKVRTDPVVVEEEKEYQRWGHLLEPAIAEEFSRRQGVAVHRFPYMIRSTEYPWMTANLDYLAGDPDGILEPVEIKTTRKGEQWKINDDGSVDAPLHVIVQDLHQLSITDAPRAWNPVLIGGQELRIACVERDEELIARLLEMEAEFWDYVTRNVAPPVDGSESTRKALQARWTAEPGKSVELAPAFDFLLKRRTELKAGIAELEVRIDEIDAQIMADLGEAEIGTRDEKPVVTWKSSTRTTLDTKALKAAHPELASEFSTTKPIRTLRFPTTKE